ncbi:MAG: hypothetical protein H7A23_12990 [Leptospiraceae bacterium]|nr:hypothetical protein [Leptospiraceae bacterium]MCP5495466.1 hypothetical protein [Leptospiraceae bacterium]
MSFTSYIIVHPDDYAIGNSGIIENPSVFKEKLQKKVKSLISKNVNIYVMNLVENKLDPPEFLMNFKNQIQIIPLLSKDSVSSQVFRLKKKLFIQKYIKKIIITGGWKDACLKFTINHLIKPSVKISDIAQATSPIEVFITFEKEKKNCILEIDHEFIF